MIGSELGQFQIEEQIGAGAQATVYRAYQPAMDRHVAVKVIPRHFASDPTFVQRFRQEAMLVARLEHPHILPVYDFGEDKGVAYIAMRYLEAGTLKDILVERQLPLPEVVHLLCQLSSALAYAHRQGVVHRDVKPANIMIDREGNSYLTDFGVAKIVEGTSGLTASGTIGTPAYMSPEQGMAGHIDGRSDIYAMGVLLYHMLTRRLPYEADTGMSVILMHMNEPVPKLGEVWPAATPALEEVIYTTLAKQPDDRYQGAIDFCDALRDAAGVTATAQLEPVELQAGAEVAIQTVIAMRGEAGFGASTAPGASTLAGRLGGRGLLLGAGGLLLVAVVAAVIAFATGLIGVSDQPESAGPLDTPVAEAVIAPSATPEPAIATPVPEEVGSVVEPTAQPTSQPTIAPTPLPLAELPFVADMEAANALNGWAVGGDWQVVSDFGNNVLFSDTSGSRLTILSSAQPQPEWVTADTYFVTMRVKLDRGGAGRLLLSQSSNGDFYAVDFSGANVILERFEDGQKTIAIPESTGIPLQLGRWYDLWVWRNGQQVSVYVNNKWFLQTLALGALPPGTISLQTTGTGGLFVDDITISIPHPASQNFEAETLPATWTIDRRVGLTNGLYSQMIAGRNLDTDDVAPNTGELSDFTLICQFQAHNGNGGLHFRKSGSGFYDLQFSGGNAVLERNVNRGDEIVLAIARNVYGPATPRTVMIDARGEHLSITVDGKLVANLDDPGGYLAGTIALDFGEIGDFSWDDCIIYESAVPSNAAARFVTDLWETIGVTFGTTARPAVSDGFSQLQANLWVDAQGNFDEGPGAFVEQGGESFYTLGAGDSELWWRMNENLTVFAPTFTTADEASTNFIGFASLRLDSGGAGAENSAWVGIRAVPSFVGSDLDQYRVRITSGPGGDTVTVESAGPVNQALLFSGPLPPDNDGDGWQRVMLAAQGNQVAFYVNGVFLHGITVTDNDRLLGTLAIGVTAGSAASFDDVEIWDLRGIGAPNRSY